MRCLRKKMPEIWQQVYPRIYSHPPICGDYCSPKEPAHMFLVEILNAGEATGFDDDEVAKRPAMIVLRSLVDHFMPQIWISKEIAHAIQQTKPPMDVNWTTMQLPFPATTFMIPRGVLNHPSRGDVRFITYCRTFGTAPDGAHASNFFVLLYTERRSTLLCVLTGNTMPIISLGRLARFQSEFRELLQGSRSLPGFDTPLDTEDHTLQEESMHMLFGALLVMAARPNLITESNLINRVHKKREAPKEFWTCRVLGENYKIRRLTSAHGGSHSSPRLHWVMGHLRDQPYGPGQRLRRLQWIDPFTRGQV
jgi:hypothetical protein